MVNQVLVKALCDLISGHKTYKGYILVDSIENELHSIKNLQEYIGYVGQEPLILNENFYKNISLQDNYEKNKIEAIGKIARLDEFINSKTNKYNEIISENGKNLSEVKNKNFNCKSVIFRS